MNEPCCNEITPESLRAIVDYIEEGEPDINVIKSELNELILRNSDEYDK
jgi:hypothetical protein